MANIDTAVCLEKETFIIFIIKNFNKIVYYIFNDKYPVNKLQFTFHKVHYLKYII